MTIFPDNAQRGLPGLFSTYVLYDASTGEPLAQIDGNEITSRRTAAASALAASYLAPAGARSLLVVGCGRVGSLVPEAYRAVLPIERVVVWDRDESAAKALAARLCAQNIEAAVAPDLAKAVNDVDVVSCATLATQPLVQGAWLRPRSHLDLIGSFTPQMREADDACFAGARLFVDTQEALHKSGELLGPMSRGVFAAADVAGELPIWPRAGFRDEPKVTGGPSSRLWVPRWRTWPLQWWSTRLPIRTEALTFAGRRYMISKNRFSRPLASQTSQKSICPVVSRHVDGVLRIKVRAVLCGLPDAPVVRGSASPEH